MDDLVEQLKADVSAGPRGRIQEIADGSGVALKVLRNVYYGYTHDMRHSNATKLVEFFARERRRRKAS